MIAASDGQSSSYGFTTSMDMLVSLLRTLSMIVVWWTMIVVDVDVHAAVVVGSDNERGDRSDGGWRRQALRLMDIVGSATIGARNCSTTATATIRMHIPLDEARRHWRREFTASLHSASQFVVLLQNTLSESSSDDYGEDDGVGVGDDGGSGRSFSLYGLLARAVVETDDVVRACAIHLTSTSQSTSTVEDKTVIAYRSIGSRIHSVSRVLVEERHNESSSDKDVGTTEASIILRTLSDVVRTFRDSNRTHRMPVSTTSRYLPAETWTDPYYNCTENAWFVAFHLPLFVADRWRGALMVSVAMDRVDVDQCANGLGLFAGTDLCTKDAMQCVHRPGQGFRRGSYACKCAVGYFASTPSNYSGSIEHSLDGRRLESTADGIVLTDKDVGDGTMTVGCEPCWPGCDSCEDASPCYAQYDPMMRGLPLGLQSFCMTITIVLCIYVFQLRKCKVIASGMWTVLEMILIGAFLIYSTMVVRYFEPTTVGCLLEPWLREMGFAICYGTIVLKLYRVLVEFRTRKAHRSVIRDKDLLKYLVVLVLVVVVYMAAWTAISLDHMKRDDDSLVVIGRTTDGRHGLEYAVCKSRWWDYVTETGEFVFMAFAVYITYHIRNAHGPYYEKRCLCLAVYVETLVSTCLYIFRHGVWLELHPDYIFVVYFLRCQLTVTVTLVLVFGPKFWYHYRPPRETDGGTLSGGGGSAEHVKGPSGGGGGDGNSGGKDGHDRIAAEMLKLQDGITSNGEVDIGEINLADMDPEDIRAELRRVYTQLQQLRNKTMRKDNPHISKRRGGRKATHRRFSLQAFHRHHRQQQLHQQQQQQQPHHQFHGHHHHQHQHHHHRSHHHHDPEHETEISKTPEESTGSATDTAGVGAGVVTVVIPPPQSQSATTEQMSAIASETTPRGRQQGAGSGVVLFSDSPPE